MSPTTTSFVDFYEVLQIAASADDDQIRKAIKTERRTWVKRQSAADPKRRVEAEERVRQIDEAEKVLLNEAARQRFDRQKANHRPDAAPAALGDGDQDWVERAQVYLDAGNAHFAGYAAREATRNDGSSHRAWSLRARSSLLLGKTADAVFEFNEAIRLEPTRAEHHFDLGSVHEAAEQWKEALACYETAAKLEPSEPLYRVSIASVYLQNDLPQKALPLMEEIVRAHPDVEPFQYYLATALNEVTILALTLLRDGTRVITKPEQIDLVKKNVGRARGLKFVDPELRAMLDHNYKLATEAEAIKWRMPGKGLMVGIVGAGADMGCAGGFIAMWVALFIPFAIPIIAFVIHPAIGILATGAYGYWMCTLARVPGWKLNQIEFKDSIVSS